MQTQEPQAAAPATFATDLAEFVNANPVLAVTLAAVLALLVMLLVRKILGVAMVAVVLVTVIVAALVGAVGLDQAREYLEAARQAAPVLVPR